MKKGLLLILAAVCFWTCEKAPNEDIVPVAFVDLNKTKLEIVVGDSFRLEAKVSPVTATNKTVIWTSSSPAVADVSESGLVTAHSPGTAVITATADGKSKDCQVIVLKRYVPVTSISFECDNLTMKLGETYQLNPIIMPEDATDKTITWVSHREDHVVVDENGLLTAVGLGGTTIVATIGECEAWCQVMVDVTNNMIIYTSMQNTVLDFPNLPGIVSNTYNNGFGTILFEDELYEIPDRAFQYCYDLTSIALPETVTRIGDYAFEGCSFYSFIVPDGVVSVGTAAFKKCYCLSTITIPNSVTNIGAEAFYSCPITHIELPEKLEKISSGTFFGSGLTFIHIPENVKVVEDGAFEGCQQLESVTISEGLVSIGAGAFTFCQRLKSVVFPKSMRTIGTSAFESCSELTSVTFSDGITTIEEFAFKYCQLSEISIPETTVNIGEGAFGWCPLRSINGTSCLIRNGVLLAVAAHNVNTFIIPEGITRIGAYCFSNKSLQTIELPSSLLSIGANSFSYTLLTEVTLPPNVTSVAEYAFSNCEHLLSVVLPDSLTEIGDYAFSICNNLSSIIFSRVLRIIGEAAFYECYKLEDIILPDSIEIISDDSFALTGLNRIVIPQNVKEIGRHAFMTMDGSSVEYVIIKPLIVPRGGEGMFGGLQNPIYVPEEAIEDYKKAVNWSDYAWLMRSDSEIPSSN